MYLTPCSIQLINVFHVYFIDHWLLGLRQKWSIVSVIGPPLWCQILACGDAKVLIKSEAMLRLSDLFLSKELRSVGCGSTGCDASNEWSFGGPGKKWSIKVPDIYWRSLGSILDFPKKHKITDKGISWEYEKRLTIK